MTASTMYPTQSRKRACEYILHELHKNGIKHITFLDIAKEFDPLKPFYQTKKRGYIHIPDFEVECVLHRLLYRHGK